MNYGPYIWTCQSCGHVNGWFLRKRTSKCVACKTLRGKKRNVSVIREPESQYILLDRNRRNQRRGCPGKGIYGHGRSPRSSVMTHPNGTAWGS